MLMLFVTALMVEIFRRVVGESPVDTGSTERIRVEYLTKFYRNVSPTYKACMMIAIRTSSFLAAQAK
jgi:hypothetical protein